MKIGGVVLIMLMTATFIVSLFGLGMLSFASRPMSDGVFATVFLCGCVSAIGTLASGCMAFYLLTDE